MVEPIVTARAAVNEPAPVVRTSGGVSPDPENADGARLEMLPNGSGAAAILAAGVGSLVLGVTAFLADVSPSLKNVFNLWNPSGPLSGVSFTAVFVWLLVWFALSRRWAAREVNLARANVAAFAMLIIGLLLTFPPFMDLLQGK